MPMKPSREPFVMKIRNAEDESSGDSFEIFQFSKVQGRTGEICVERDKARDPDSLTRLLLKRNADLPTQSDAAKLLIQSAIESEPESFQIHAKHVGWRNGRRGFVLKSCVIKANGKRTNIKPPLWVNDRQPGALKCHGSLDEWRHQVAEPAAYSSPMMLVMSAAFAAPLLKVVGIPNFGVNLFGLSKVGKTTALLAATSIIGIGQERGLPNWNGTSGAFLETARTFNDQLLAVNEVGLLAGKRGDAYPPIRERIYTFSEGVDRARMSASHFATSAGSNWRGIFVSTAEYSFNEYAAFSGETRSEGEFARCLDVAAAIKGMPTVFDRYPVSLDKKAARRWARNQLHRLRRACEKQCGAVFPEYIKFLITQGRELRKKIRVHQKAFMTRVKQLKLDGALEHAAKNFALIYAGGCLAIDAEILPWKQDALLDAVFFCFESAVKDIRGHVNAPGVAKKLLRERLRSEAITERTASDNFGPKDRPGYFERKDGKVCFTIASAAFAKWFGNRSQRIAVLRWLHDQGLLDTGERRANPSLKSTEWAERQRRWPDGSNPRSITFFDPFGSKS